MHKNGVFSVYGYYKTLIGTPMWKSNLPVSLSILPPEVTETVSILNKSRRKLITIK